MKYIYDVDFKKVIKEREYNIKKILDVHYIHYIWYGEKCIELKT